MSARRKLRAGSALAQPHLDADLLRLGKMLDEATAREAAAWKAVVPSHDDHAPGYLHASEQCGQTGGIVDQILAVQAVTPEGALVKVRAIVWCRSGEPFTWEDFAHPLSSTPATDPLLMASLINDLAIMGSSHA